MPVQVNYYSKCCGLKEIDGLTSDKNPERSMLSFCSIIYPTEEENTEHLVEAKKIAANAGVPIPVGGPNTRAEQVYWGSYAQNGAFESPIQYGRFRFATFSEAVPPNPEYDTHPSYMYGRKFAAFITDNGLGTVVASPRAINPNSGNNLQVWVWCIDHDTLKAWYEKVKPKPEPKSVKGKVSILDALHQAGLAGIQGGPNGTRIQR